MSKFFMVLVLTIFTFTMFIADAEARRFGGGKSFGHSRSFSNTGGANTASRVAPAATAAKTAASPNRWLAPLAGLALGGVLASLFMGHGIGTGILSWLMVAGVIFILWRLISRLRMPNRSINQAAYQTQPSSVNSNSFHANADSANTHSSYANSAQHNVSQATANTYDVTPIHKSIEVAGFDETTFLRQAKTVFIRLQAAYDAKDLADIRDFTAPEIYAEIQVQIQEMQDATNHTEVLSIDAELLDLEVADDNMLASVQFSGSVKENDVIENIKEIWHFSKKIDQTRWLIVGIQQASSM